MDGSGGGILRSRRRREENRGYAQKGGMQNMVSVHAGIVAA